MPYHIPSYPKLIYPSPIACVPKTLGLSWTNYARYFREHAADRDVRGEAGVTLGAAMLRHYFPSVTGFRQFRACLWANWGAAETTPHTEILEGLTVEDMAMWIVEKKKTEGGAEEGVRPSVEVQDYDEYDVHTILIIATNARFMAKEERLMPSVLPVSGQEFVVRGKEVRRHANVVVLTGNQSTQLPQLEFYKLDADGFNGKSLVPAMGMTEEHFGTHIFGLGKEEADQVNEMWMAAAKEELKEELKLKGKLKTKAAERYAETPESNSSVFSLAHLHSPASRPPSALPGAVSAVKNRTRKQTSRALSASAPSREGSRKRKRPTPEPFSPIYASPFKPEGTPSSAASEPRRKKQKKSAQLAAIDAALRSPAASASKKIFCCPFVGCPLRYTTKDSARRHFKDKHVGLELDMADWEYTTAEGVKVKGQHVEMEDAASSQAGESRASSRAVESRASSQAVGGEVGLGGRYSGLTSKKRLPGFYEAAAGVAGVKAERADSAVAGDGEGLGLAGQG